MKVTAGGTNESDLLKFNYYFKWNRILLKILGIWPQNAEEPSISESFGPALLTFLLATVVATQWADLVVVWGQFDPMIDNLSATLGMSLSIVKLVIIRKMLRRAKIGRIFSIASPAFSVAVALLYSVLPLTLNNRGNSTDIFAPFPLRAVYFFDPSPTPIYQFIYLAQSTACFTSSISQSAIDSFLAALVMHACGQLDILGQKFRSADKRRPMIKDLVQRHLYLIRFAGNLESVYSAVIFSQLLVSSLAISGIGYRFIMSLADGNAIQIAKFSFYLTAMLMEIFIYCYAGQDLIDESTRLNEAAYDCRWYDMNPSDAKALLLIQTQAQLPLQITALNFCVMSHQSFTDILRSSATYLSVLRTVKSSSYVE